MPPAQAAWTRHLLPLTLVLACLQAGPFFADAVKIVVDTTGMYRVTGAEFAAAGVDLALIDPATMGLTCQGQPVACRVDGLVDRRLSDTSQIIFRGEAADTRYTGTNVYWLRWGVGETGPRMGELAARPTQGQPLRVSREVLHLEGNHEYGYLIWVPEKGELDPWFWTKATPAGPARVAFDLPHLSPTSADLLVCVAVRGRTAQAGIDPDHHVVAELDGSRLGERSFDAQAEVVVEGTVPRERVRETGNELAVTCPGDTEAGTEDQVYLDWVEVAYDRLPVATDGRLEFEVGAGQSGQATVSGLSGNAADVYQITPPGEVACAAGLPVVDGSVSFAVGGASETTYAVVSDTAYLSPRSVEPAAEPYLRSAGNGADLVVIAWDGFCEALAPLVEHRRRQGLRVAVVPVSRIYDEFSDGLFSPVAIRNFLRFVYEHWARPAPRYVLLVGDANYDYRDYLGTGQPNYVPAYPVRVRYSVETPTDAFYGCLEGDDHIPEMIVGRLPARSAEQARRLCERIVAYETQPPGGDWRRRALVVADHEPSAAEVSWFENSSEVDAQLCEAFSMAADRVYLRAAGWSAERSAEENRALVREKATPVALEALREGCALFLFQGHGAAGYLSRQRALETADVRGLDNGGRSPLGVLVTCFAGAFDDPQAKGGQCIAEQMLEAPSGLIACIGPTRLGGLNIEVPLLRRLLSAPNTPIGQAFAEAKQDLLGRMQDQWELVENYNLLGDPLLRLPLEVAPPPETRVAQAPPTVDLEADANGNRVADLMEKHVAEGVCQRYGPPEEQTIALFCRLQGLPSADDIALVARLQGKVMDIVGPPWGMEIVLPTLNVAPLVAGLGERLLRLQESERYGQRVEIISVPPRDLPTDGAKAP